MLKRLLISHLRTSQSLQLASMMIRRDAMRWDDAGGACVSSKWVQMRIGEFECTSSRIRVTACIAVWLSEYELLRCVKGSVFVLYAACRSAELRVWTKWISREEEIAYSHQLMWYRCRLLAQSIHFKLNGINGILIFCFFQILSANQLRMRASSV